MKRSIHLSESSEAYIAARNRNPVVSAEINAALAMLQHLVRENLPKLSDTEWEEIIATYRGRDLTKIPLPLNIAGDILAHHGVIIPSQLLPQVQGLPEKLVALSQVQQFAIMDTVRTYLAQGHNEQEI